MNVAGTNNYGQTSATDLSKMNVSSSNPYDFSMQDFFTLMIAQMTNQSLFDPVDDTQFMAQMAQFSSMQAMQQLTSAFMSSMSVSFIGKYVVLRAIDQNGKLDESEGIVDAVNFQLGQSMLLVNGKWYTMDSVVEIHNRKLEPIENDDGWTDPTNKMDGGDKTGGTPPVTGEDGDEDLGIDPDDSDDLYEPDNPDDGVNTDPDI